MFKLTIECATLENLDTVVKLLRAEGSAQSPAVHTEPKTTRAKKEAHLTPPPAALSSDSTGQTALDSAGSSLFKASEKLDAALEASGQHVVAAVYDDVKNAVLEVAKQKGREASLDLLSAFGVVVTDEKGNRKGNIKDLKEDQFSAVIENAKKMLAA